MSHTPPTGPNDPTPPPPPVEKPDETAPLEPQASDAEEAVERTASGAEDAITRTQHRAEERIAEARDAATEVIHRTQDQVKAKVHETETMVRGQIDDVQRAVGGGLSEPKPAESIDEATDQAADLRKAIDRDIDALQAKLPPEDVLKEKARTYGGVAVAVLALVGAAAIGFKQRGERKKLEREAKAHAAALARYLPQAAGEPRELVEEKGSKAPVLILVGIAAAIGASIYKQQQDAAADQDVDLWGPA